LSPPFLDTISKNYDSLSIEDRKRLHQLYLDINTSGDIRKKLESILFRVNPPTPKEYLDYKNGWISKEFQESVYPYIKEDFIEILDKEKNYSQAVEYGATRLGKSYLARMLIHYIIIFVHCLRQPQLYYGLSPTTNLSIYIMSFVAEKANQLLLKPIYDILDISPRFRRSKFQDKVAEDQYKNGLDNIYWSKAATFGHLTLESKLTLNTGVDFMSFIGTDLLFLVVSEISFFIEKAGATHDQIFQLYSDGLARIKATVGNNYLGMVFLDSSANDLDNPIEQYILKDLSNQEGVFFRRRSKWEIKDGRRIQLGPNKFPKWIKTGKTFKVCLGDNNIQSKIIETEQELKKLPPNLIIEAPIDLYDNAKINILKFIKDDCGLPTKKENKFISDNIIIEDIFNNEFLYNIIDLLYADASEMPDKLLWDQLYKNYFSIVSPTQIVIKRAPLEPRYFGMDLAHAVKGDIQGLTLLHKEWSKDLNKVIYIADFSFGVFGRGTGINLEAGASLVLNLINLGGVTVNGVYVDTFQSKSLIQSLERMGVLAVSQSVDRTLEPYQALYTALLNKQIKTGKNIFLKNNLDSLIISNRNGKQVIDHSTGQREYIYNGNWGYSKAGVNSKDVSDSLCQAFYAAFNDTKNHPFAIYEDENRKLNINESKLDFISKGFKTLHKWY